jgi:hypothetical protein
MNTSRRRQTRRYYFAKNDDCRKVASRAKDQTQIDLAAAASAKNRNYRFMRMIRKRMQGCQFH